MTTVKTNEQKLYLNWSWEILMGNSHTLLLHFKREMFLYC